MENKRNSFLAIALSVLIVIVWQFFYMNPRLEAQRKAELAAKAKQATEQTTAKTTAASTTDAGAAAATGAGTTAAAPATSADTAANSPRISIDTPSLSGSIRLAGARIDDLKLKHYRETVDPKSPLITLFSPSNTKPLSRLMP